jgi:pimeloyl-ACP methyl ester carboxylesterase
VTPPIGVLPDPLTVMTARGIEVEVRQSGSGPDVLYLHGLVGLLDREPMLDELAERYTIHAPIWPGYGRLENETGIEDMLDFALLGWDIVDALGLRRPHIVGHSFGAMIASEMACIARNDLDRLVLAAPYGLWVDTDPLADPFAVLPFHLVELLLHDQTNADTLAGDGLDLSSNDGLAAFMISNARRLGTAGKIMFPIPNRRLSKRLYRLTAPTLVMMAEHDRLVPARYGAAWTTALPQADLVTVPGSGHLLNIESSEAASIIGDFLAAT